MAIDHLCSRAANFLLSPFYLFRSAATCRILYSVQSSMTSSQTSSFCSCLLPRYIQIITVKIVYNIRGNFFLTCIDSATSIGYSSVQWQHCGTIKPISILHCIRNNRAACWHVTVIIFISTLVFTMYNKSWPAMD